MKPFPKTLALLSSSLLVGILAACSLATDVTPPPNYQSPTAAVSATTSAPAANISLSTSSTQPPQETPTAASSPVNPTLAATTVAAGGASPTVAAAPATTGTPQVIVESVSGAVTNGSGGSLPKEGLTVTLHGYDTTMAETVTETTSLGSDGIYLFPALQMPSGQVYMTSIEYKGVTYNSEVAHPQSGTTDLSMPITVYDTTTDAASLSIDRMHVFFDFSSPGTVQVVSLFIVSNSGKLTVTPTAPNQPLLKFPLPAGATNLQFQDGQIGGRYVQTSDGFGDTQPVPPNTAQYQILFAYDLPYTDKLDLSLPVDMNIKSSVVMVPNVGVALKSAFLQDGGEQTFQGTTYHLYSIDNLTPATPLKLTLSGNPDQGTQAGLLAGGSTTGLILGGVVFILALGFAGLWLYRSRRQVPLPAEGDVDSLPAEVSDDSDALIDAIAALDDLHQDGKIAEEAYHIRREELKERLRSVMK
ncbi:MAG: hypothetical protein M1281_14840 [Chloroflexi bacterium]|nr:hypothetical protein [Chloroflexota bacterium]